MQKPGAAAQAILSEIKLCAERLAARGETSLMDQCFLGSKQ
jgi:hypothetical protein